MSSIALFPCRYAHAEDVATKLANRFDLQIYSDTQLIEETSRAFNVSAAKLDNALYGKTSVFNQFTLEREKLINMLKNTLHERLDSDTQFLFEGFLTSIIPSKINHVLKVLIVDSKSNRIKFAEESGVSTKQAQKEVKDADVAAYNWTDFLFKKEAYDKSLYDLVIPAENKSEDDLIETIAKCFQTTSLLRTSESQRAVTEMKIEIDVERILLENGHKIAVEVSEGTAVLTVEKSVLNFAKLEEELSRFTTQVRGVDKVSVRRGSGYNESIYRRQKFELPSKVLFVDDEKEFVQTVSERLISRDVGTYGVYNGEEALEVVSDDRPDVMVLDLKMPGLHGVEVLRQTKEVAPEVEVIILTGHGTMQDMQECMELGAFAYLNKPVDIEELSATIKAASAKAHGEENEK